ncbi:MAG: hypothetical protein JSS83_25930 [Cyanobacteria bacterium SZAS LIN-3]|nr:hypothetical protein [Cyanobacteria bacterium SZAS LIN-3]
MSQQNRISSTRMRTGLSLLASLIFCCCSQPGFAIDALSQAYLEQGQRDFDRGDYAAAKKLFNKAALNLEPSSQSTLYAAAVYSHASACYRQLAAFHNDYQDLKDDDLAVAFLRRKLQPPGSGETAGTVEEDQTIAAFNAEDDPNKLPSSDALLNRATLASINRNYRLKLEWISVNYMRLAMKLQEAQLGPDSVPVAYSMESLGLLYSDFDSQLEEAEALFRKALAIRESKQGKSHSDVALNLYGLGTVLKTASDTHADPEARGVLRKESVAALERCLSILQELGLSKSILAARCLGLLSTIHITGPLEPLRAVDEFEDAYDILKKDSAHKKAFNEFKVQHKNQANLALGECTRLVVQAQNSRAPSSQLQPLLSRALAAAQRADNQVYIDYFQNLQNGLPNRRTRVSRP